MTPTGEQRAIPRNTNFLSVALRLLALTLFLNLVRYLVGGPIEAVTIMAPMHEMIPRFANAFDMNFSSADYAISLAYNYLLWFAAVLQFYLMWPALKGPMIVRSVVSFAVSWLAFAGLALVYMNHFDDALKAFYLWSIVDAAILFPLVGLANGVLYPMLFGPRPTNNRYEQQP